MKLKQIVPAAVLGVWLACLLFAPGCASTKLDPAGVYGAMTNGVGTNLYHADLTITTSYNEIDGFIKWEQENHAFLATNAPAIVAAANTMRVNAPKWVATASALRDSYAASATVSNANAMTIGISVLETAATQATNYTALKLTK